MHLKDAEVVYEQLLFLDPIVDFIYKPNGEFIGLIPNTSEADTTYYGPNGDSYTPDVSLFELSSIATGINEIPKKK